jgi:inner membrane protein involved in colicin E2 resistance
MALSMFEGRPLAAKLCAIVVIVSGLMIPMSLLRGLILERSQMRAQAVANDLDMQATIEHRTARNQWQRMRY